MKYTGASINSSHSGPWVDAIGKLIINFGHVEYLTYEWMDLMGASFPVPAKGQPNGLAVRIDAVRKSTEASALPKGLKRRVKGEWINAEKLLGFRNRIAHGPIVFVYKGGDESRPPSFVGSYSGRSTFGANAKPENLATVKDVLGKADEALGIARNLIALLNDARKEL